MMAKQFNRRLVKIVPCSAGIYKDAIGNESGDTLLSIIVPVYNVFNYLDRCLESVLSQSFKNFEVILINDGSTDGSDEKCLQWARRDQRIQYISTKNQGLGPTRNLGIKVSRYDYVTFIDADDWWSPDYIEKMLNEVLKYNADIVACDINYVQIDDLGNTHISESQLRFSKECVVNIQEKPDLLNCIRTFLWGKIYSKNLFLSNGIVQPSHAFEDIPVTPLLTVLAKRVCRVGEPLYYYLRNRKDSLANDTKNFQDILFSLKELKCGFEQRKLFHLHSKQLMRLSYGQMRFIARKGNQHILVEQLFSFMKKNYADWKDLLGVRFGIIGNRLMGDAVGKLVIYDTQIKFLETALEFLTNKNQHCYVDYMIIDGVSFLPENDKLFFKRKEMSTRVLEECKEMAGKICFVKTYPNDINRNKLEKQYLQIIGDNHFLDVVDVKDYESENCENDSWNIADELFMQICCKT